MKKIVSIFFIGLGVIFFCLILALIYLWIFDPFNLKPLFQNNPPRNFATSTTALPEKPLIGSEEVIHDINQVDDNDLHPALTESQENALEMVGINPAVIPAQITPAQEACFVTNLGLDRVEAIKNGDTPTVVEIFKGKDCLNVF